MRKIALVYGEEALGADRLVQTIENAFVQVARLVVHAGHDRVCEQARSAQKQDAQ